MHGLIYILFALLALSCNQQVNKVAEKPETDSVKPLPPVIKKDSVKTTTLKTTYTTMIGKRFSVMSELPQLNGYRMLSGGVLDLDKKIKDSPYCAELYGKGDTEMLLFEYTRRGNFPPHGVEYEVLDTLFLTKVITNCEMVGYQFCMYDSAWDPSLIAIFHSDSTASILAKPIKAWKIDLATQKIVPTDTAHIRLYQINDDNEED